MDAKQMLERAASWTFKEDTHYNGGKSWFGRGLTCVQEPRLSVIVRYDRKLKTVSQAWRVDGIDHVSFDIALAKLIIDEEKNQEEDPE